MRGSLTYYHYITYVVYRICNMYCIAGTYRGDISFVLELGNANIECTKVHVHVCTPLRGTSGLWSRGSIKETNK